MNDRAAHFLYRSMELCFDDKHPMGCLVVTVTDYQQRTVGFHWHFEQHPFSGYPILHIGNGMGFEQIVEHRR